MPVLTIVGAGPGLGLAVARRFGREGFKVALVARTQEKLEALAAELGGEGIEAAGFAGDILDRPSLAAALSRVQEHFGAVDVLSYSPAPQQADALQPVDVLAASPENTQQQVEFYLYGAMAAVQQVLPAMTDRGSGTLLFTTGASSATPMPAMGNVGAAAAGLRNYALALNAALAELGVYAAHVPLAVWIGSGGPATQPETIAEIYWDLHTKRDVSEHLYYAL